MEKKFSYMTGQGQDDTSRRACLRALERFAQRKPQEMAHSAGAIYQHEDASCIVLPSMGQIVKVDYPQGTMVLADTGQEPLNHWRFLTLQYLWGAKDINPEGEFISYKELENGHVFYPAFFRESISPLANGLTHKPAPNILAACQVLGSVYQGKADISAEFYFFPKFPVHLSLWLYDEEIGGSANLLFDRTANQFLHTEDIAMVGQLVSYFLLQQYKQMFGETVS